MRTLKAAGVALALLLVLPALASAQCYSSPSYGGGYGSSYGYSRVTSYGSYAPSYSSSYYPSYSYGYGAYSLPTYGVGGYSSGLIALPTTYGGTCGVPALTPGLGNTGLGGLGNANDLSEQIIREAVSRQRLQSQLAQLSQLQALLPAPNLGQQPTAPAPGLTADEVTRLKAILAGK